MRWPAWFFTRASCFAALLIMCVLAMWSRETVATTDNVTLFAALALTNAAIVLMLLLLLWLAEFPEPHDYDDWQRMRWFTYFNMAAVTWIFWDTLHDPQAPDWQLPVIGFFFGLITWGIASRSVPRPGERLRGEPREKAYLLLTLDMGQQPPVAIWAGVFSHNSLTTLRGELVVEIDCSEGDSFQEARASMIRMTKLYYPALVPLLRRSELMPEEE